MTYRNLFLEFMYEYREYFADYIQLVILENNKTDDLVNFFAEMEEVHVFHSRDIQVFYKKRNFNDVPNTLIELALINDTPQTYELESLNGLIDIYNDEPLANKPSRYVFVKPIILDDTMKAVLIVYSNYQTEWMVNDKKLIKLCNGLQLALSNELYNDVEDKASSKYWLLKNNSSYYLSKELSLLTNLPKIIVDINLKGLCLKETDKREYLNSTLMSYEHNCLPILESQYELVKLSMNDWTFMYFESAEDEGFSNFYDRLVEKLSLIDGQLGKYHLYQIDNQHIVLIFLKVYSKKMIEDLFNEFSFVLIRSGNEIKQKINFEELIEYLKLSPIETFNYEYFKYFVEKFNSEKINKVLIKTSKSKIKIIPIFDSFYSNKKGYLIKDSANIKLFDKNSKQKSLLSILKIAEEYKNDTLFLEIPCDYLFEGNKLSLSRLNKIHKYVDDNKDRVFIITNYQANLNKIYAHWPEFNKYVYFYDIPYNLYQSILSIKNSNGLYINSNEYREFFDTSNIVASEFIKYILQDAKNILINVKKTDIIKYQQENLLLVCE